jgi:outer membrane immunogenic protein
MRRSLALISAVSVIVFTQFALAADLPRKAPAYTPPPAPVPLATWTGWYVGLNAGGHWSSNNDVDIVSTGTFNPVGFNPAIMNQAAQGATLNLPGNNNAGFIGGGQIGYNWQLTGWVFGIEADFQGVSNNNNFDTVRTEVIANNGLPIVTTVDGSRQIDWFGTVRGRLGWLATPTLLLYGTGGLAYGHIKSNISITQSHEVLFDSPTFGSTFASNSKTRAGWTAGAGFEWMFFPRWSAKVEYLYYDLGDQTVTAPQLQARFTDGFVRYGITPTIDTSFKGNIVRAGVNYHF